MNAAKKLALNFLGLFAFFPAQRRFRSRKDVKNRKLFLGEVFAHMTFFLFRITIICPVPPFVPENPSGAEPGCSVQSIMDRLKDNLLVN
jgi:hypothetical protein